MKIDKSKMKWKISHGITIVELLVYIGLLSIFMLVLLDIFTTILNAKLESESTSSLNQDARYIYSKLSYDIENADNITVPSGYGSANSTHTLVISNGVNTYTYSVSGDNLNIITNAGLPIKLNGNDTAITAITFTKIGPPGERPTVNVSYTIKSLVKLPLGDQTRTINTTYGLRP